MEYRYLWAKMKGIINYCCLMMHHIAHIAGFLNGLQRQMMITCSVGSFCQRFTKKVLVSINHILAGYKANKQ